MKKTIIVTGILIIMLLAAGLLLFPPIASAPTLEEQAEAPSIITQGEEELEQPVSLTIACVGDVMVHSTQFKAQYDSETKTYVFNDNFQYVKPYIEEADLALFNLETVFAGGPPEGYPTFNAPDSLADSLKDAGFDAAFVSNNHILDQGSEGLRRTLKVLHKAGLETSGAYEKGSRPFALCYADGVRIGLVSYTYETPSINGAATLNGNVIPSSAMPLFNSFSYASLDSDIAEIGDSIRQAREAGAEIVVCYFHWGEEYQREPGREQRLIAKEISRMGADIIFASHPHVVQPVEVLTNEDDGRKTAVFYSMGNFISNQRSETLDNRYTEQGIIAQVSVTLMRSSGEITDYEVSATPLWVDRYRSDRMRYAIIPLDDALDENPSLKQSGHIQRATTALDDLAALIGDEYIKKVGYRQ